MVSLEVWTHSILSVVLVSLISLVGIVTIAVSYNKINKFLIYMVAFAAGALMGDAFIHLLPEIAEEMGFTLTVSAYILAGIVSFFIIEKIIHWHHCHHVHDNDHKHEACYPKGASGKTVAMMNLIGDSVHNFIDGIIIGVSYLVSIPVGIATTIAVVFHEIPQEIGDFGILLHGGYSRMKALMLNLITALAAVIGVVTALLMDVFVSNATAFLIPFAAGGFIYIAGSDLIPELHSHEFKINRALLQLLFFLLGIGVMALLLLLE